MEYKIEGLSVDQAYVFRVAGENECGVGDWAEMQKPVSPKSEFGE